MAKKTKKAQLRKDIQGDLLDQLERNGTAGAYYTDMVSDYMKMWDAKNQFDEDIGERGAVVDYVSNTGAVNKKKNESVEARLKVNAQMLKLLDAIGIKPAQEEAEDDEL